MIIKEYVGFEAEVNLKKPKKNKENKSGAQEENKNEASESQTDTQD